MIYENGVFPLDHRVILLKAVSDLEKQELVTEFENFVEVWAHVEFVEARTELLDERLQQVSRYKITIRYRNDILSGDRLIYRGEVFTIHAAYDENLDQRFLVLDVESLRPQ